MKQNQLGIVAFIFVIISISIWVSSCDQTRYVQGQRIYTSVCENCHMDHGQGLGSLYPDLTTSAYLTKNLIEDLPCLIKMGKAGSVLEGVAMPPHPQLGDVEMTNLINYLSDTWGDGTVVKNADIQRLLDGCGEATSTENQ